METVVRNMEYELLINLLREQTRPFFQLKPNIFNLGNGKGWSVKYGDLVGIGKTPAEAAEDFDKILLGTKPPKW
jgi:hypothetical protein